MTWCSGKFMGFLGSATTVIVAEYVLVLSDSAIAGHLLGETALGAVNLLMPLFSCVSFFTWLLAVGTSVACTDAVGRLDGSRAAGLAGQGFVASWALGVGLAGFLGLGLGPYFSLMAPDRTTFELAASYGRWYPLVACLEAVDMTVLHLVYAYGGKRDCAVSYAVQTLVNVGLSYALCGGFLGLPALGMEGIALGTAIAYAAGLVLLLPAVLGRRGGLALSPRWMPRDLMHSLVVGFGDASAGLSHALLFFVVTKYCVLRFGSEVLPVLAVVFCVVRLTVFFNGVGIALAPLETVYHGEGNELAVRNLVRFAALVSLAEGILMTGVLLVAPGMVASLVGIADPLLHGQAIGVIRLTSLGLAGYAIAYLLNSHYQFVGCPGRSVAVTMTAFFAFPAALVSVMGSEWGMKGACLAVAVGPMAALVVLLPLLWRGEGTVEVLMWTVCLDDRPARERVLEEVHKSLSERSCSPAAKRLADILMLAFSRLGEQNEVGRPMNVEASLLFDPGSVRLIIRDDGGAVALEGLGRPVVHLPAAGFNRNVFFVQSDSRRSRPPGGARKSDGRYVVVHGRDASPEDVASISLLDGLCYDIRYQGPPGRDLELFRCNRENGLIVKEVATGAVVAYTMILPVKEEIYVKIRAGEFIDSELTHDMVLPFDAPGSDYRMYFASAVIHPAHRSASLLLRMLDAMEEDFVRLAERGVFARSLTADVVSREGEKLAHLLGLSEVCSTSHDSRIFEACCLPPALRETTPVSEQLVSLYWKRFVENQLKK